MDKIKTLDVLQEEISSAYNTFFEKLEIDPITGMWENAPVGEELRFATMPFIGSKYAQATRKILFIGMDIGRDEGGLDCGGTIVDFNYRKECFSSTNPLNFNKCANAHVSGTIAASLYLLKDSYPEYYSFIAERVNTQNKSSIFQLKNKIAPNRLDVLDNVAQLNFYKFVTKNRNSRQGKTDRRFWNNEQEEIENLLLKEIEKLFKF